MNQDELKQIVEQAKQQMIIEREARKAMRLEHAKRLKELINDNDLVTLRRLVKERAIAQAVLKTASVESYIDALKDYHAASIAVLEFALEWAQDIETGLLLFKIDDLQYSIKENKNGVKYIGYKTEKGE